MTENKQVIIKNINTEHKEAEINKQPSLKTQECDGAICPHYAQCLQNDIKERVRTENKPIMIDGVDVSSCDFLAKEDDYCSYSGEYRAYKGECGCSDEEMCKDHPNCFYKKTLKQLTRKTQECEKKSWEIGNLGYKIKNQRKEINERLKQLKAKEQECEELEKKLNYIRDENIHLKESATDEQIDFLALNNYIKTLEFQIDQLKAENEELKANSTKWKTFNVSFDNGFIKTQISDMSLTEYSQIKLERDRAEQKLEKTKDRCNETLELMNKDSGTNAYAGGRCIEAENILQIIDEVE